MAKKLLPDELTAEITPLVPADRPRPKGGRPPVGARDALGGILFVLYTAIPWERLPFEVAGCSAMICWRRLRAWQDRGVWDKIHRHLLDKLKLAGGRSSVLLVNGPGRSKPDVQISMRLGRASPS